jgi:hypothetical protein
MAVKSKAKSKVKAKAAVKKSAAPKVKVARKSSVAKPNVKPKPVKKAVEVKTSRAPVEKAPSAKPAVVMVKRTASQLLERRRPTKQPLRTTQFNFMKAPGVEHVFEVGDTVEVFCDHEKNRDRIRGWVKGIVVQVDHKLAAVQFRSNVYLTDGWMVPDRILWFPINSENIRPLVTGKKPVEKKEFIPDY